MRIEERRALLGDMEPQRRGVRPLDVAAVLLVCSLAGTTTWLFVRARAADAARVEAVAEADAVRAKSAADIAAAQREADLARGEARVAADNARLAAAARAKSEGAADAIIAALLGSTNIEIGGESSSLAQELLRGERLKELEAQLPEGKYLAVALAVVESLAREASAANSAEVYRDIKFATDFLAKAHAALDPAASTYGDALHAVAQLMWSYRQLAFLDPQVATALRSDARKFAEDARIARSVAGGRALALTLVLLAEIEREDKHLTEALAALTLAKDAADKDALPSEKGAIDLARAALLFELGKQQDAVEILGVRAALLEAAYPTGNAMTTRVRETRVRMLETLGVAKSDEQLWMSERLALARACVQSKRFAAAYALLPDVAKHYQRDQSRFRERVECMVLLARAMDALGSTAAASESLDQKQLVDDVRILGDQTALAKEYESLRTELRAKAAPKK